MHYMVHYPSQILKYGPLIYAWTMRHEAKLSVLKHAASHGNFKNIAYTVAKQTLHALCYHLNCEAPFLSSCFETSKTFSEVPFADEKEDIRTYFNGLNFSIPELIKHPNWIKIYDKQIKKFACVYLGNGEIYPKFGKIVDLFEVPTLVSMPTYSILIQHFDTLFFDSHFGGFAVNLLSSFSVYSVTSLSSFPLFHSHKAYNQSVTYIVLKQYIM